MTVVSIQRTRNGVLTSADLATLTITDSTGATVLPTTEVTPESAGVYVYTTSALVPDRYTATWVFTVTGLGSETIARAFQVDPAIELSEGVMLMELERLVARRIGPGGSVVRVGAGSTTNSVYVPRFRSSLGLGSYEDQYLFRRGITVGDELVPNFTYDDRIRLVATYTASAGTLAPDRAYTNAPIDGEAIELHVLDPIYELRVAVQDALRRCFFWDTITITVTATGVYNINVTLSAPWVTDVNQIREVALSYPSQLLPPRRMQWWQAYREGKDIKLYTKGGAVGSVTLLVLRPVHSFVNGEVSLTGPNDDFDVLYVDRDYAAWAGVLECWKNHPELLMPLAAQGMRVTRDEAAAEFTKKSLTLVQQVPERYQIDYGVPDIVQIGNLAEPVS